MYENFHHTKIARYIYGAYMNTYFRLLKMYAHNYAKILCTFVLLVLDGVSYVYVHV